MPSMTLCRAIMAALLSLVSSNEQSATAAAALVSAASALVADLDGAQIVNSAEMDGAAQLVALPLRTKPPPRVLLYHRSCCPSTLVMKPCNWLLVQAGQNWFTFLCEYFGADANQEQLPSP